MCLLAFFVRPASAQSGAGTITGTVADATGAVIPGATVTALNVATGVKTVRIATSSGLYTINPINPGTYTVTVTNPGFSTFKQENIVVDALGTVGLNVMLKTGDQAETITISAAPPQLETTDSTLGGVIENSTYTALPLLITGGQQRDVTQFSNLLPGAQVNPGGRSSIIGGTGQRVGELYVDGLPLTTASQQGDNRPVFNLVPLEAIDQIKVVTTGYSSQYSGAGLENYNLKAGTNQYHGSVFAYIRNTIFDTWSFSSKPGGANTVPVVTNGVLGTAPGPKPAEHQIEYGVALGGPITIPHLINGHDKLFFYATFDKFRSRLAPNYVPSSIPTLLERQGNFQELLPINAANPAAGGLCNPATQTCLNYAIYDPTSQASCTAHSTNGPCRYQYGYGPGTAIGMNGNPVLNGSPVNVIPTGQLSPITQYMAKFLPQPLDTTIGHVTNNYSSGVPTGFDNYLYSVRVDYTVSPKQTLSAAYTQGSRHAVPYTSSSVTPQVNVLPYIQTTLSTITGNIVDLQHTYQITPHLVNQARYGFFYFGGPPVQNITGTTNPGLYGLAASGITGLPAGQASMNAANLSFSGTNAPTSWVGNTPTTTSRSLTYEALDNISWTKGINSMNFGGQVQWLEDNADTADGASTPTSLAFGVNETANLSGSTYATNTGYSYASFLLGAVASAGTTQQAFSVVGGRFRPAALYFQDDIKVTSKLTINAGIRWDYIPPYHETLDRWSFLNPSLTNAITGNAGALQFAGHRGAGLSCQCTTPVNTYWKNFQPRFGFAYQVDPKTVFRGGYSLIYSHGGATGGAAGAGTGTGQTGFNTPISYTDSTAGPAFYLNNNPSFSAPNANFGGPTATLPGTSPISAASQTLGTGFYTTSTGASGGNGTSINYADPYVGSRAPEFSFYNFGMQREITKAMTISLDYSGSQSHFISGAAGIRGLYAGQLNPKYLTAYGNVNCSTTTTFVSCLTAPATAANLAKVQAATGSSPAVPYAGYTAAAGVNTNATLAHMLTWMPQYSGTSDFWGNYVANGNYNAFQVALAMRASHGLTFNVNYTYSQNIDDAGTQRSGYDIPGSVLLNGQSYRKNRIDRSLSVNDQPESLSVYGVYSSQYGKHSWGGEHFVNRALLSGWQTSWIFQYSSGAPLPIVATCNANQNVGQGTCMPDVNANFTGDVRINGKWGQGVTAATLGKTQYLQGGLPNTSSGHGVNVAGAGGTDAPTCAGSTGPFCNSGNYMIGDAGRFAYGLRGPDIYRLSMALRRTFPIHDRVNFIFGVDGSNLTNHTTFGNNAGNNTVGVNVNSQATFGTVGFASADSRDFQFSGRIQF
ncbi:TonB-dependent receptor [Granulicella rosea]|nr:TonB-dependent receptor [Granulicella rosea]